MKTCRHFQQTAITEVIGSRVNSIIFGSVCTVTVTLDKELQKVSKLCQFCTDECVSNS